MQVKGGHVRKLIIILFASLLLAIACTTSTQDKVATLKGSVFYLDKTKIAHPLDGVLVVAKDFFVQAKTDANGTYTLALEHPGEESTFAVELQFSKVGFAMETFPVNAKVGETIQVPDMVLQQVGADTVINPTDTLRASGPAKHITVLNQTTTHIYIKGSGLIESAVLNFIVTDANGIKVDRKHRVQVKFYILNGPNGGEYIYPDTMTTRDGYVYTVLNSGTIAGAVQIVAEAEAEGETIRSNPIRVAIHGGLPDQEHFSIVAEKANIAGRAHYGITDQLTAFVGDKYSNPVAPGTIVYFKSDYCIVEGSAVTDELGRATVRLISSAPIPPEPLVNPFATITAYTYSDTLGSKTIQSSTKVLLTDVVAPIEVEPTSFTYSDLNEPVQFSYKVHDIWGFPLVSGTSINVDATAGNLYGDINIEMKDTQRSGPGTTEFSFTWAPGDSLEDPQVYINIVVDSPPDGNGYVSTSVLGTKTSD